MFSEQRGIQKKHLHCAYLTLGALAVLYVLYHSSRENTDLLQFRWYHRYQYESVLVKNPNASRRRPNILLVLTDDQDSFLGGFDHMSNVQSLLVQRGSSFQNAFVANPLCCPSRASLLTGRYVHNHGTVNNSLDGHCADHQWQMNEEKVALPIHLSANGYRTFFAGKYLNQYGKVASGGVSHVPPGWDSWTGLVGNSRYYNYTLSVDGLKEIHGDDPDNDYLTSVIWRKAKNFLNSLNSVSSASEKPFFMMLSTPAPHGPFTPLPQYSKNFSDLKAPRTPAFNLVNDVNKHWLLRLGKQPMSNETISRVDEAYRNRLRTLLTVDDMVGDIIKSLEEKNLMDNTYIIFTSDNGYHLGQFSLPIDKREPYETDIRVPFVIRGPGIEEGKSISYPTVNVDLAPTILDLAQVRIPKYMDGVTLLPMMYSNGTPTEFVNRNILIEHSGEGYDSTNNECSYIGSGVGNCNPLFDCKCEDSRNNSYACVRQLHLDGDAVAKNVLFCQWYDNESFVEFYNLTKDENQLVNEVNTLKDSDKLLYGNLLTNLTQCVGKTCL